MNTTMQDVARLAGVSAKTVSNVVNNQPNVGPETRARVQAAIERLGYKLNVTARNLRRGSTGLISLAVPELKNPYFAELADSIISEADRAGLRVLITQTNYDRDAELEVLHGSQHHLVDGLLFSPIGLGQRDVRHFAVDFPLVILGESVFDAGHDHVTMSNIEAARAATEHLLALGRRRIALLGAHPGEEVGTAALRLRGYSQALLAHGLPISGGLQVSAGLWHLDTGAQATRRLIDSGVEFDAIFALNDLLARGALSELARRGIRVPEDVAVIGFDDTETARYTQPPLSSVEPGRAEIAATSVRLLLRRIAAHADRTAPQPEPELVNAAFRIMSRQSTTGIVA